MEDALGGQAYILKAKKFAEPLFQSKKFAEKVRKSGRHFWAIWGNCGPFWVIFGPLWIILGHSRAILGHLGSYLGHFGPFWVILGHFWAICSRDSRETLKYGTFGRKKFYASLMYVHEQNSHITGYVKTRRSCKICEYL